MTAPPIEIVEVSPRDGLQNEKTAVSTGDKVELVLRAIAAGARRVEAVSFVNPKTVPQMADAEAVMSILRDTHNLRSEGVTISGLALNRRGLDRALAAGVDEVNFVVIASETFNRRNQGASIAGTMSELERATALCHSENMPFSVTIGAAFGCPFEGEVPLGRVTEIATQAASLGAQEIALADTIGVADPPDRRMPHRSSAVGGARDADPLPLPRHARDWRRQRLRRVACGGGDVGHLPWRHRRLSLRPPQLRGTSRRRTPSICLTAWALTRAWTYRR